MSRTIAIGRMALTACDNCIEKHYAGQPFHYETITKLNITKIGSYFTSFYDVEMESYSGPMYGSYTFLKEELKDLRKFLKENYDIKMILLERKTVSIKIGKLLDN